MQTASEWVMYGLRQLSKGQSEAATAAFAEAAELAEAPAEHEAVSGLLALLQQSREGGGSDDDLL